MTQLIKVLRFLIFNFRASLHLLSKRRFQLSPFHVFLELRMLINNLTVAAHQDCRLLDPNFLKKFN